MIKMLIIGTVFMAKEMMTVVFIVINILGFYNISCIISSVLD